MLVILKISVIAICGVILAIILKNIKSDLAVFVSIAISLVILFYIFSRLSGIISQLKELAGLIPIGKEYILILIKITGITYMTQIASDICRDNGHSAIAGQLEIFSKLSIAVISMPVFLTLFEMVKKCI